MSGFNFTVQGVGTDKAIKGLNDMFRQAESVAKAIDGVNQKLSTLRDRSAGNRQNRKDLITELTGDPAKSRQAFSELQKQLKDLQSQMRSLIDTAARGRIVPPDGPLAKHRARIKELTNQYLELSQAQRSGKAGKDLLAQVRKESQEINRALAEINQARGRSSGGSSGGGLISLIGNVGKLGLAISVVQKFTDAIFYAEETIRNFDAELTNLGALLSVGDQNSLGDLERQALTLGQTTAFTAVEVVKLQTELTKLGFSVGEVLAQTPAIIDFSVAVRESADRVALLTGATLKGFNISSLETRRVVDTLTDGINRTALSFSFLETALPIVASAAKAANVDLGTTVSVLGKLADEGVQASTAGTAFRNILIESAQRGLEFRQALDLINSSANPLSTAFNLFGKRGAVQGLILAKDRARELAFEAGKTSENMGEVSKNAVEFGNAFNSIGERISSARQIADTQLTSIQGKITLLKSAWDGFLLSVGNTDSYKKASIAVTELATDFLNATSALLDGTVSFSDLTLAVTKSGTAATNNLLLQYNSLSKLAGERRDAEQATVEYIQEQFVINRQLFNDRPTAIRDFRVQTIKAYTEQLKAAGVEAETARLRAIKLVDETIKTSKQIQAEQQALLDAELEVTNSLTIADIRRIDTLSRAKETVDDLQTALGYAQEDSAKFNELVRKAAVAQEVYDRIARKAGLSTQKQGTAVKELSSRLSELESKLKSASSTELQLKIFGDIQDVQTQLKQQETFYFKFLQNIRDAELRLSSEAVQKDVLKIRSEEAQKAFEEDKRLILQREGLTEQSSRRIQILNNKFQLENLRNQLLTLDELSAGYKETVNKILELTSETYKLNFEISIADFNNQSELNLQQEILKVRDEKLDSLTEEQRIKQLTEQSELNQLENERASLKAKEAFGILSERLGFTTSKLTEEEQRRAAELENLIRLKREELNLTTATLGASNNEGLLQEQIRYFTEVQSLVERYNKGELKDLGSVLINGQTKKTAEEAFQDLLDVAEAKYKINIGKIQEAQELAAAEEIDNEVEKQAKIAEIKAKYAKDSVELGKVLNKDEQRRADQALRDQERRIQRYRDTLVQLSEQLGEAFGAAIFEEDGAKEALKSLLKTLVDIYVKYLVGVLSTELLAALASLNFGKAAALSLGIAAVAGAGAAAKGAIDQFQDGGIVQGPSHSAGGVKARVGGGRVVELEGDEYVINRHATAKYKKELDRINSYKGYGTKANAYRPGVMENGGLLQNTPQILTPVTDNSVTMSESSIVMQAEIIAQKVTDGQLSVLVAQNDQLVKALQKALDFNRKLSDRFLQAEKSSKV